MRRSLRAHYDDRVDPAYGWDGEVVGYSIAPGANLAPPTIDAAMDMLTPWLAPLPDREIGAELARLQVSCKSRPEVQDHLDLAMRVLGEECALYPADAVRHVLRRWAQRETFTPSLAELRDRLQRAARSRHSLAEVIANHHRQPERTAG